MNTLLCILDSVVIIFGIIDNTVIHELGHIKIAERFGVKDYKIIKHIFGLPTEVSFQGIAEYENLDITKKSLVGIGGLLFALLALTIVSPIIVLVPYGDIAFGILVVAAFGGSSKDLWKILKMWFWK